MKINIITLGCSKNTVDSENIAGNLRDAGHKVYFDRTESDCDVTIVNTCGFIGDSKEESIDTLLEQIEIKTRSRKQRRLIAVGCLVERYKEELQQEMPQVDEWYGVHEWEAIVDSIVGKAPTHFTNSRMTSTPRHYAYLKIAEGCNRQCSYCAIPNIRGRHISRPIDELVEEAKQMVACGVKEIILIAQDTTYYGVDLYGSRQLGPLMERLAKESGAEWIRLHYTYPTSFPKDAIEVMKKYPNICNYIDIPLQHINSGILQSMQRGIDREGTIRLLDQFREELGDVAIRTTLIVGYPGETQEQFDELKEFVKEARFDRMGCFPYSPEEGTPAYALGDPIDEETKAQRVDELMAIQEQISLKKNEERVGKTYQVMIDRKEGDFFIGRTEYDSPEVDDEVLIQEEGLKIGEFYRVTITDAMENDLIGKIAE